MTNTITPAPAESAAKILRLRNADDLVSVRDRHAGLRHQQVVLDLPGLTADERTETARKLTELLDECGCDTGAQAMVAGAVLVLGGLFVVAGGRVLPTLALSPFAVVGAVVGAGTGKAYGLARSRRQFRREINELLTKGA
ncbi:MAG: hypothetical protein ABI345_09900 [Jatrophihabitans sp.]